MHLLFAFPTQNQTKPGTERENKMKNVLTNLMTSAVLLFTIGSGLQAQNTGMHAAIPFAWQLNGQQMNAGDYAIGQTASTRVIRIESRTNRKGSFLVATPASDSNPTARLVFHHYGNQYFLAEVVTPGGTTSKLSVSRAEKEAMLSEQPREVATVLIETSGL
jgi:hypothetical protein